MLFNEPMTRKKSKILILLKLPSQMHKTKIFYFAIISLIHSRRSINEKEKYEEKIDKQSWTRSVSLIRQPVKEQYILDENDLLKLMSEATLTTPFPTSHNPYIISTSSTTRASTTITPHWTESLKDLRGELFAVRNLIELEKLAPVKCAKGSDMDTYYYKLENKSGLFIRGMI